MIRSALRSTGSILLALALAVAGGGAEQSWSSQRTQDDGRKERQDERIVPVGALADAVEVLEKRTGGKALEIRLADEVGAPVFEAALSKKDAASNEDEILYMRLETPSDGVTAIEIAELPEWMANWKLHAYIETVEKARVPLTGAITKAERKADAPAIGAGLAEPLSGTNAVVAYYVEVVKGREPEVLAIEATRGSFIANPETLYVRWTPVKLVRRLAAL